MLPVLFHIGSFSVSSLGVMLVASLFYAIFLVWRLARAWDFDEEKVLDLTFITALGAFVASRIYYVVLYFSFFSSDLSRIFLIFKYPGFSFWGAFLGGWLTLYFVSKKQKMDFAKIADIAAVGFLGALILSNVGCLLGGCGVGVLNNSFLGVKIVGYPGKSFPIQIIESLILIPLLINVWVRAKKFHTPGKIVSRVLIWVGLIKFITEFFRAQNQGGQLFSMVIIVLGVTMYYRFSRRNFYQDLSASLFMLGRMTRDLKFARMILSNLINSWYNNLHSTFQEARISFKWKTRNLNKILKKYNVKPTTNNP